ncbi:MAG: ABC transporter permease [Gemmatimonadaceae bacterium]
MSVLWNDVRYGVRVLLKARAYSVVAVAVLGVGIGASTTLYSAIDGVLRRPLPYERAEQLVALGESNGARHTERAGTSAANFTDWREAGRGFEGLAAYVHWGFVLSDDGRPALGPERVLGARVSASLFSLLGVRAVAGRVFRSGEDSAGRGDVVVLSEELWRRRFGGSASIVGDRLRLNAKAYTVVGVVARGFELPAGELWIPLTFASYELDQRGARSLSVVARLKAGVSIESARDEMRGVARTLARLHPEADAGWEVAVSPLQSEIVGDTRTPLLLLFTATCAVMLVACANLATLMLARGAGRRGEIALRAALGAGRWRVVRQLVTESMLVVVAGAGLALALSLAGAKLLSTLGPEYLPRAAEIRVGAPVVAFLALLSLAIGIVLSAIPAIGAATADLAVALKTGGASGRRHTPAAHLRDVLVVCQVAVALLLLVDAGLLVRSFARTQSVELGFNPASVLAATVSLPDARYPEGEQRAQFFRELARGVRAVPGVRAVGLVSHPPLAGGMMSSDYRIDGQPPLSSGDVPRAQLANVDPGYFRALELRVVRGRGFTESDRVGVRPVAVVDESLARQHWPGGDAIGARLRIGSTIGADTAWREIVGVVAGVRSASPIRAPAPTIYVPHAQNPWPTMSLVVRTTGEPTRYAGVIRAVVLGLDPNQPLYNVRPFEQVVARTLAARRFQMLLLIGFAVVAVFLAAVGVYGLLAYAVAQRTRELGIRVALGARDRDIYRVVLRQAGARIAVGLALGGAAAIAGSRSVSSLLFEVSPWDPATLAGAIVLLAIVGLIASYIPARRAAHVDPALAFRREN